MKLQRLHIKNFKSIVDLEIVEPNPFTVFVGPNGSGKSNIFEALEFSILSRDLRVRSALSLFGGIKKLKNFSNNQKTSIEFFFDDKRYSYIINVDEENAIINHSLNHLSIEESLKILNDSLSENLSYLLSGFSRVFVRNQELLRIKYDDDSKLNIDCSNLEKVLKRILLDENKREEIKEWLDLFIPGFENIEIVSSDLSGTDTLVMYEKGIKKPFTKDLLSDGTYNILALLTAVYQSDEPQFLCIEEPENGLTPYVIEQFVELFRTACQEKGHYIWLNTHSPNLVRHLRADELIVVDKKQGATQIKQFKGNDYFGLRMDEAWLTNALGGGLPW